MQKLLKVTIVYSEWHIIPVFLTLIYRIIHHTLLAFSLCCNKSLMRHWCIDTVILWVLRRITIHNYSSVKNKPNSTLWERVQLPTRMLKDDLLSKHDSFNCSRYSSNILGPQLKWTNQLFSGGKFSQDSVPQKLSIAVHSWLNYSTKISGGDIVYIQTA